MKYIFNKIFNKIHFIFDKSYKFLIKFITFLLKIFNNIFNKS